MSLPPAAAATTPARQRGEYLVDQVLLHQPQPVAPGHSKPNRYHKRNVRDGFEKQQRLEQIEAALLDRIERIAREFDEFPERFQDVASVQGLLDVKAPSIEVVD